MTKAQKKLLVYGDVVIVGMKKHYARIYDQIELDIVKPFQFHNNREGFYRLVSKINEAMKKNKCKNGSDSYGTHRSLLEIISLVFTVVIFNPYHVKRRKEEEENNTLKKTDRKDAGITAKLVKHSKILSCLLPKSRYADLRNLTVTRRQLKQKLNGILNRLQAILDEYFPELKNVFKNITGKAALWVLRHCPFPGIILSSYTVKELAEKLKKTSNHQVGLKRAKKIYETAKESIEVTEDSKGAKIKLETCLDEVEIQTNQENYTEEKLIKIYKNLSTVENAFKTIKNDLDIRPMYHWKEERVKGHVYICVLAYFIVNAIEYMA